MAQLTAYTLREYDADYSQLFNTGFVKASAQIYRGSALGTQSNTAYVRQLVAGDSFQGFAEEDALGTTTDGAVTVGVRYKGAVTLTLSGAAVTDLGRDVYLSDGNTPTYTVGSNSYLGRVIRVQAANQVIVAFDATRAN